MAVNDWSYPMSGAEMYMAALYQQVVNMLRSSKEIPLRLGWPWPDEKKPQAEEVTPEERAELAAQLKATSAFGQIRTEAAGV